MAKRPFGKDGKKGRYTRQALYIGTAAQAKIERGTVVVIGAGALGSVACELLVRAGIGSLSIIDRDCVELHNLQRQFLFTEADVGMPKAAAAKQRLEAINSTVHIDSMVDDLDYRNIKKLVGRPSVLLDCTDNMETRFLINDYCRKQRIPWVHAAVVQDKGTVLALVPTGPCFRCVFERRAAAKTCESAGILNMATTATSALQVMQALRLLLEGNAEKSLFYLNLWSQQTRSLSIAKRKGCPACQGRYDYLEGKLASTAVKLCGEGAYQLRAPPVDLRRLSKEWIQGGIKVRNFGYGVAVPGLTLFNDGRAIIKARSAQAARSLYAKLVG